MNDNAVYGGPKSGEFIETRIDYNVVQEMIDEAGSKNAYIGVYIQMDDSHKITIR